MDKTPTWQTSLQKAQQADIEEESRKAGNFLQVEAALPKRWSKEETAVMDRFSSALLGSQNPFVKCAHSKEHIVWVLDSCAYRPIHPYPHNIQPWQAEIVACFFKKGRKDIGKFVGALADQIGLDGKVGADREAKDRITQRLQPFVNAIAPARTFVIKIPGSTGEPNVRTLGPSNRNGISSEVILTGGGVDASGTTVTLQAVEDFSPPVTADLHFVAPQGWAVISDIDDSIKYTQTSEAVGILKTTFADVPQPIPGMPELYKEVNEKLKPAWFYLSASPYNLYPFLRDFLHQYYPPGTLILRDNSWMDLGGLLKSFTQGVQPYKVDRMEKIHQWLPQRRILCVGDSTQKDPESYAEIYKKYHGWVDAIFIRKVTNIPNMEEKNKPERFEKAFEGIPSTVWKVFESPDELNNAVEQLAGSAHTGVVGTVQGWFCKE